LAPAACNSPAAPTVQTAALPPLAIAVPSVDVPPGPPVAVLAVESVTLVRDYAGDLAARLRLVETSGLSSAVVVSLGFNLADGEPWRQPVLWSGGGWVVPAGGSAAIEPRVVYGDYEFTFEVPAGYAGGISVSITFADNQGRRGTVTAVAALPR
jgi:hypothetical protein